MAKINIDSLHYAKIIKDDATGLEYDTPIPHHMYKKLKLTQKLILHFCMEMEKLLLKTQL